jgi:hypothetical protein
MNTHLIASINKILYLNSNLKSYKTPKTPVALVFFILIFSLHISYSQIEAKVNLATAPLLIPNVGLSIQTKEKQAIQLEVLGSFWNEFPFLDDTPLHINQAFLDYRWYQKPDVKGWFLAPHIGYGMFTFQKPDFLVLNPTPGNDSLDPKEYKSGRLFFYGLTLGYKWELNEKWALEAFVGGGYSMSNYKGYEDEIRTDRDPEDPFEPFNLSGEAAIHRGGLMLVYTFSPYQGQ